VSNELVSIKSARTLTSDQYAGLADVPPEIEWLNNITNDKTRRFYKSDGADFVAFTGLKKSAAFRTVAHSHVIAWRKDLEDRKLGAATIRRKLSALSSLFDYLCERNAVLGNPVDGVKRPATNNNEGSTPALGDAQARRLLEAPAPDTLKGVRDRAILATLFYHGICSGCAIYRAAKASCIYVSTERATRFGLFPFTRWCCGSSANIWKRGNTAGGEPRKPGLSPLPACGEQSYRDARPAPRSRIYLSKYRHEICNGNGDQRGSHRSLRAFDAGNSCDKCPIQ